MKENSLAMTRRSILMGAGALTGTALLPLSVFAENAIQAQLRIDRTKPVLSPLLYGGFIEHIGNLINHSLWSEVLDDRKFFHGILSKPDSKPTDRRAAMGYNEKWSVVGDFSAVSLDKKNPWVGEHSPSIKVTKHKPQGFMQGKLALAGGKSYNLRIVVEADKNVNLSAILHWGNDTQSQQKLTLKSSRAWSTQTGTFSVTNDSTAGRLEIIGKGKGQFKVGAISLMPSDNIRGFRADTLTLMKEMQCPIMRMPGGNFVSSYDWKNTIGEADKRPPTWDPVWSSAQPNDVGVDELLQFCELIDSKPFWCVNTGFGEPRSGAQILEYVNGSEESEWGSKRAANGHIKPYGVKYWAVGNEMYGHWQMGHMARDQYVIKHNMFVDAMRKVDPSIYIVAPGGFVDEMTTGQGIFVAGQPEVKVGSERDWAYAMFDKCWGKFDALGTHAYPPENKRFDLKTGKLFDVKQSLNEWAHQPANRVRTMSDAWNEYKTHFPKLNEGKVKIFFDEWAFHFKDDLKGALAVALTFHEFFRHTDFIDMAGYTMATGWLDYTRTQAVINTRGRIFQLYQQKFGSIPIAVEGNIPVPPPEYPIGGDQPRINAGSATYPLDVSAALTTDKKTLVIAVVNATEQPHKLTLQLNSWNAKASGISYKFTGPTVDSANQVDQQEQVTVNQSAFDTTAPSLTIAPISVEIYHFPMS